MRKKLVHIGFIVGLVLIIIGAIYAVHLKNDRPAMLKIETVADDATVKGNHFPKSAKYYDVAANGDVTRSKATASFKACHAGQLVMIMPQKSFFHIMKKSDIS